MVESPLQRLDIVLYPSVLAISFVVMGPAEVVAQGTNATNATNASSTAGGAGGQMTIVMPAGSVDPNSATGYDPAPLLYLQVAQ